MSDREDMGAGLYAALTVLLFLICLVGAFVLPPWVFNYSRWVGILILMAFFVGMPILLRFAHRSRIKDAVQKLGGTVVRIKQLPFWKQPSSRYRFFLGTRHRVEYVDLLGATHRAVCKSGYFQGVVWLEDTITDGL